jgi:hypothetical protein
MTADVGPVRTIWGRKDSVLVIGTSVDQVTARTGWAAMSSTRPAIPRAIARGRRRDGWTLTLVPRRCRDDAGATMTRIQSASDRANPEHLSMLKARSERPTIGNR